MKFHRTRQKQAKENLNHIWNLKNHSEINFLDNRSSRGKSQLDVDYRRDACIKYRLIRASLLGGIFDYIEWDVKEAKEEKTTRRGELQWDRSGWAWWGAGRNQKENYLILTVFLNSLIVSWLFWNEYLSMKLIKHEKRDMLNVKRVCLIRLDSVHDANYKRPTAAVAFSHVSRVWTSTSSFWFL